MTHSDTIAQRFTQHAAASRGPTNLGWLDSRHSFSFGRYHNPAMMGFRSLRVINDDRVTAGAGFGEHGHENMEIVSYVVSGGLAHKDSLGNGSTIKPGDVQRMSAGSGVRHSEFNPSKTEPARFLQIWILPEKQDTEPSYEEKSTGVHDRKGELLTIVSPEGSEEGVRIHQDVSIHAAVLDAGHAVSKKFDTDRYGWVQVVRGDLTLDVDGSVITIGEGDGVELAQGTAITATATTNAEVLVFDLS